MRPGSIGIGLILLAIAITSARGGAAPAVAQPGCSWAGTWDTAFLDETGGEEGPTVLRATQDGAVVTGAYEFRQGVLAGVAEGPMLAGSWMQGPTYRAPEDLGEFYFVISPDCEHFHGRWRYAGDDVWSVWIGTRRR